MATVTQPRAVQPIDAERSSDWVLPISLALALVATVATAAVWYYLYVGALRTGMDVETTLMLRRLTQPLGFSGLVCVWLFAGLLGLAILGGLGYGLYLFLANMDRGMPIGRLLATGVIVAGLALYLFILGVWVLPRVVAGYKGEQSGYYWLAILIPVLLLCLVYAVWMYVRDSQAVGGVWATFLGMLRCTVYFLLTALFLMPALQTWERSEAHSKVLLLIDLSGSMQTTDEQPTDEVAVDKLPTRLDKSAKLLAGEQGAFLKGVQEKNPVTLYGFGGRLDEDFRTFKGGKSDGPAAAGQVPAETKEEETSLFPWFWIFLPALLVAVPFHMLCRFIQESRLSMGRALGFGALRLGFAFALPVVILLVLGFVWWPTVGGGDRTRPTVAPDLAGGRAWTEAEWMAWMKLDPKQYLLEDLSDEGKQIVQKDPNFQGEPKATPVEWANSWLQLGSELAIPAGLGEEDREKLKAKREKLVKKIELRPYILNSTNVGDSVLAAYTRESNHMLAGVIVISDGRSNQGSAQAFDELRARAAKAKVPIFAIGVGEDRQPVQIVITDLQAPEKTPPDEKFPVRVEVDGPGLPDREIDVFLDIFKPKADPKKDRPTVTLTAKGKFQPGQPPHAQVEFQLDPAAKEKMQALLKTETTAKPELEEGEYTLVARIPKDRREVFKDKEHVSDPVVVSVIKKPLRVLLMAGGPTRDYQFARTLFVRGIGKWCELSVYLQHGNIPGERVQDVDPNRLLAHFPTVLRLDDDPTEKPEDKYYNLAQYDLIVAYDPDWTQLQPEQLALLQKWVDNQAGGLIVVGGPINTYQLARGVNFEKLKPALDLYPVVLDDSRLQGLGVDRSTADPWRLNFPGVTAEMEFLKLDDDGQGPTAGWEEFFTGQKAAAGKDPLKRGFYGYYPVKSAKPGATVIATFTDPRARLTDGKEQPFVVTMPYGKGKVVWLGSGEFWRLRQLKEIFHERFWTKLGRFASAGSQMQMTRRGTLILGNQYTASSYVRLEAQIFQANLEPLPQKSRPRIKITPPDGVTLARNELELTPKPTQGEWQGWFQGRFLVTEPGEYRVDLEMPGSSETASRKFLVKEANPELDNMRPDFAALYQLAGDLNDLRLDDESIGRLRTRLRPETKEIKEAAESPRLFFNLKNAELIPQCLTADSRTQRTRGPAEDLWDDGPTLDQTPGEILVVVTRTLIFLCGWAMIGLAIYFFVKRSPLAGVLCLFGGFALFGAGILFSFVTALLLAAGVPMMIATAMLVVVTLLSIEWLTRKLLRLA